MPEHRTDPPDTPVQEHHTVAVPFDQLTSDDIRRLEGLQETGSLTLQETRHGWRLHTRSIAGVLVLDRIRLTLRPKFPIRGDQLITWLCYANAIPVPHEQTLRRWRTGSSGYADVVLPALLAECHTLLRRGLNRGYHPVQRVEPTLRGRLDIQRQATRRYGAIDRLHVRTFDRDPAIWENLICGAALSAATPMASQNPDLARELRATAARFPQPQLGYTAARLLRTARYNRLNDHYRAAHLWSALVLGGGGVSDLLAHQGAAAKSVLLSVDRLWELVVRRMAEEAAQAVGGRLARPDEGRIRTLGSLTGRKTSFRPDGLLAFDTVSAPTRYLAVDAKHKALQTADASSTDRHQLLTYIAGYTTPQAPVAVIVHPAHQGASHRTLRVQGPRGLLGIIEVLGLDVGLPPRQAAQPLRELITQFEAAAP